MKRFFAPNLARSGRVLRGALALAFFAAATLATGLPWPARALLAASGAFTAFEALRGWCFLRACGLKTRL